MIRNDEEFARTQLRLELLKNELALVRHDVLPDNRRTHDLMCEYFDQRIAEVHAEIEAYIAERTKRLAEPATSDVPWFEDIYSGLRPE
jgi:hypothetical protein